VCAKVKLFCLRANSPYSNPHIAALPVCFHLTSSINLSSKCVIIRSQCIILTLSRPANNSFSKGPLFFDTLQYWFQEKALVCVYAHLPDSQLKFHVFAIPWTFS